MADFNAKTATPDTDGPADDNSVLFGADSQSAATPKIYTFAGIKAWIKTFLGIGDYIESDVGVAVPLTSNTPAAVTSIVLTPGDWDVSGSIVFAASGGAAPTFLSASANTAAALPSAPNKGAYNGYNIAFPANAAQIMGFAPRQYSVAVDTTVYLIAYGTFPSGSLGAYGIIRARRAKSI